MAHRRFFDSPCRRVVLALGVGMVLAVRTAAPAGAQAPFSRAPDAWTAGPSHRDSGAPPAAPALDVPVHLRMQAPGAEWAARFRRATPTLRGTPSARARAARKRGLARPAVTIFTPEDRAVVSAGTLRVWGTVHADTSDVRVVVNGVRASVKGGTFSAGVPVTPNTLILSAVATTARGVTAIQQVGITVGGATQTGPQFRPFPERIMAARQTAVSPLVPSVSAAASVTQGGGGARDLLWSRLGVGRLELTQPNDHGLGLRGSPAAASADHAAFARALGAMFLDDGPGRGPTPPREAPHSDAGRAADAFVTHFDRQPPTEFSDQKRRGYLAQISSTLASLRLPGSRDDESERGFRGMRGRAEYSFGLLFILDAEGVWRVWWF